MRLHDAVRYALYVSREIGTKKTSRFGARVLKRQFAQERDTRYILQNAALEVLARILNFGFEGSDSMRNSHSLTGRGALLSLMNRIMGHAQLDEAHIYGYSVPAGQRPSGPRYTLDMLIAKLWRSMRLVTEKEAKAAFNSNGLVTAVRRLLRKFYVGAHLQNSLTARMLDSEKPDPTDRKFEGKQKVWKEKVEERKKPFMDKFAELYAIRMGKPPPVKRRSKVGGEEQAEPSKKITSVGATRVSSYDEAAAFAVHDACVMSVLRTAAGAPPKENLVVLGAEFLNAIHKDVAEENEQDILGEFLLRAMGKRFRNPIVVVCPEYASSDNYFKVNPPDVDGYDFDAKGDISGSTFAAQQARDAAGGSLVRTAALGTDAFTHVVFVVNVSVVPKWRDAVNFWKSERGLDLDSTAGKCGWVTVLLAPNPLIVIKPLKSALIVGTVATKKEIFDASATCGIFPHAPKLALRGLRTYDPDLIVRNTMSRMNLTTPEALEMLANVKCNSLTVSVGKGSEFRLPIAVIDVSRIALDDTNVDHCLAVGTKRNYALVTTQAQHDKIVGSTPARPPPRPRIPKKATSGGKGGNSLDVVRPVPLSSDDVPLADRRAEAGAANADALLAQLAQLQALVADASQKRGDETGDADRAILEQKQKIAAFELDRDIRTLQRKIAAAETIERSRAKEDNVGAAERRGIAPEPATEKSTVQRAAEERVIPAAQRHFASMRDAGAAKKVAKATIGIAKGGRAIPAAQRHFASMRDSDAASRSMEDKRRAERARNAVVAQEEEDPIVEPKFESENVTILGNVVQYKESNGECGMEKSDVLKEAINGRTIQVTFLLVRNVDATTANHHGKLVKANKNYGALFYVECTSSDAVRFETVKAGLFWEGNPSEIKDGDALSAELKAAEAKYQSDLASNKKGKKTAPPKPRVFVLCRS